MLKALKKAGLRQREQIVAPISAIWSSTHFGNAEMTDYAKQTMATEARQGVRALSLVALLLLSGAAILHAAFGLGANYVYTYAALALLALHVFVSANSLREIKVLYLLGMTLLIIAGAALVLLAHQNGAFNAALFAGIALLFMVIPLVPWGLREGVIVTGLIYLTFTASTFSSRALFQNQALWALQFFMLGVGVISIALVARAIIVRKHDIRTRFELEGAHRKMQLLSEQDPLTAAWNRRYLEANFDAVTAQYRTQGKDCYFAVVDVDKFKTINDSRGHRYGDLVLQAACAGFRKMLRSNELLFRIGGDEFALIVSGQDARGRIARALGEMRACAAQHASAKDPILMSVGMTRLPANAPIALNDAYKYADEALYSAKHSGGNKVVEHCRTRVLSKAP